PDEPVQAAEARQERLQRRGDRSLVGDVGRVGGDASRIGELAGDPRQTLGARVDQRHLRARIEQSAREERGEPAAAAEERDDAVLQGGRRRGHRARGSPSGSAPAAIDRNAGDSRPRTCTKGKRYGSWPVYWGRRGGRLEHPASVYN